MELRRAQRKRAKLKLGITGPSGSGKTYSALLVAKGLCGEWEKIAVIDTENESASLYEDLGAYFTLPIAPPFTPERYIEAIGKCIKAGIEVIVIDSSSHEWSGKGGCLDIHEKLGGQWKDWAKVTPRHAAFIETILQCPAHVILTTRTKSDWVTEQNDKGKATPRKVGTKAEQREGLEYEMTTVFRLMLPHNIAVVEKDRTGLFQGKPEEILSEKTGELLRSWIETAPPAEPPPAALYEGTLDQKKELIGYCQEKGLSRTDKKDVAFMANLSENLLGSLMSDLKATAHKAIDDHHAEPPCDDAI